MTNAIANWLPFVRQQNLFMLDKTADETDPETTIGRSDDCPGGHARATSLSERPASDHYNAS